MGSDARRRRCQGLARAEGAQPVLGQQRRPIAGRVSALAAGGAAIGGGDQAGAPQSSRGMADRGRRRCPDRSRRQMRAGSGPWPAAPAADARDHKRRRGCIPLARFAEARRRRGCRGLLLPLRGAGTARVIGGVDVAADRRRLLHHSRLRRADAVSTGWGGADATSAGPASCRDGSDRRRCSGCSRRFRSVRPKAGWNGAGATAACSSELHGWFGS